MNRQPWYYWLISALLVAIAAVVGLLNLAMGASKDSPFFTIDDIAIRLMGAGLVASVVLMLTRRRFGYIVSAICFVLVALEAVTTWLLGQDAPGLAIAMYATASIALAGTAAWAARTFDRPLASA